MDSRRRAELLASLSPEGRATYEVLRAQLARDLGHVFPDAKHGPDLAFSTSSTTRSTKPLCVSSSGITTDGSHESEVAASSTNPAPAAAAAARGISVSSATSATSASWGVVSLVASATTLSASPGGGTGAVPVTALVASAPAAMRDDADLTAATPIPAHVAATAVTVLVPSAATPFVGEGVLHIEASTGAISAPPSTALGEMNPMVVTPVTCSTMGPDHNSDGEDPAAESMSSGSVHTFLGSPSEDSPGPALEPWYVLEQVRMLPITCSAECSASNISVPSPGFSTTRVTPSILPPAAASALSLERIVQVQVPPSTLFTVSVHEDTPTGLDADIGGIQYSEEPLLVVGEFLMDSSCEDFSSFKLENTTVPTPLALDPGAATPSRATPDVCSELTDFVVNNAVVSNFAISVPSTCSILARDLDAGVVRVTEVAYIFQGMFSAVPVPVEATIEEWMFQFPVLELSPLPWPSFKCSQIWILWYMEKILNYTNDPWVSISMQESSGKNIHTRMPRPSVCSVNCLEVMLSFAMRCDTTCYNCKHLTHHVVGGGPCTTKRTSLFPGKALLFGNADTMLLIEPLYCLQSLQPELSWLSSLNYLELEVETRVYPHVGVIILNLGWVRCLSPEGFATTFDRLDLQEGGKFAYHLHLGTVCTCWFPMVEHNLSSVKTLLTYLTLGHSETSHFLFLAVWDPGDIVIGLWDFMLMQQCVTKFPMNLFKIPEAVLLALISGKFIRRYISKLFSIVHHMISQSVGIKLQHCNTHSWLDFDGSGIVTIRGLSSLTYQSCLEPTQWEIAWPFDMAYSDVGNLECSTVFCCLVIEIGGNIINGNIHCALFAMTGFHGDDHWCFLGSYYSGFVMPTFKHFKWQIARPPRPRGSVHVFCHNNCFSSVQDYVPADLFYLDLSLPCVAEFSSLGSLLVLARCSNHSLSQQQYAIMFVLGGPLEASTFTCHLLLLLLGIQVPVLFLLHMLLMLIRLSTPWDPGRPHVYRHWLEGKPNLWRGGLSATSPVLLCGPDYDLLLGLGLNQTLPGSHYIYTGDDNKRDLAWTGRRLRPIAGLSSSSSSCCNSPSSYNSSCNLSL